MKSTIIDNLPIILSNAVSAITIISSAILQAKKDKQINSVKLFTLKQEHIEKEINYKRTVFEEYLHQAVKAAYSGYSNDSISKKYTEAYAIAFIYVSPRLRNEMKKADTFIKDKDVNKFLSLLDNLVILFEEEIQKLYK